MGFTTQAIRYGWVALASLGVLTGTTIYTLTPTRKQVKPQDIIELALGTDERVMALQTGTNALGAPIYPVARPSFVRSWKDTNGTSISMTNTIGWHTDRAMMISLDTTIKDIVPYYCDTNTVYDGTTNIAMLTVTGLWASLGIGDGTNKFTRTPEIGTNAATYGDYPWQIYVEDLQERYKVLEALKILPAMPHWGGVGVGTNFGASISRQATYTGIIQYRRSTNDLWYGTKIGAANGTPYNIEMDSRDGVWFPSDFKITMGKGTWEVAPADSNHGVIEFDTDPSTNSGLFSVDIQFDADPAYVRIINCFISSGQGYSDASVDYTDSRVSASAILDEANFGTLFIQFTQILEYPFNYCTNKFW